MSPVGAQATGGLAASHIRSPIWAAFAHMTSLEVSSCNRILSLRGQTTGFEARLGSRHAVSRCEDPSPARQAAQKILKADVKRSVAGPQYRG